MAKHRDLASIVYASTLGRTSASKIWRTVVFSGAMLGATPALADTPPPAKPEMKKEAPKPPEKRTADQINADIADRDTKIAAQVDIIVKATADADRTAGWAELEKLDKERKAFRAELKALKIKPLLTSAGITRAELALSTNETKQIRLVGQIAKAKTDKDRDALKLKLEAAVKDRAALELKLTTAKEDAAKPRPRTPPVIRPTGRGFILS